MNYKSPFAGNTRMPDLEIRQLIKLQERKGAETLYDQYADVLRLVIIRKTGKPETANKIIEEVFVTIWHSIDRYPPEEHFLSWAIAIAKEIAGKAS